MTAPKPPRRTFRQWLRRRYLLAESALLVFRIRHGRKSQLQRDWESGDPARVARVEEVAARIREELGSDCRRPCGCTASGERDDDGTPGWCDSCRMNIHPATAKAED
jgi:hypothetical protein